jgi:hypothetical protein
MATDDDCYELEMNGEPTGVVEIPFDWVRDDAVYFLMLTISAASQTTLFPTMSHRYPQACKQDVPAVSMYGLRMQANLMDGSMISKRTSAATVYSSC